MTFEVAAEAYDRFMGVYSTQLAPQLADLGGVEAGRRVLDVGCGPGTLTGELVRRTGAGSVSAVDPSEPFVAAAAERYPGVDVRLAPAEALPFDAGTFDAALAQLVVQFMGDPVAGLREMARVTRPGGIVAASVWDHESGRTPLGLFWRKARELDPSAMDESRAAGGREGSLEALFAEAGLSRVESTTLTATVHFEGFDAWWQTFMLGVGTAGGYLTSLPVDAQGQLRERCAAELPDGPFDLEAFARATRGRA